MKMTMHTSIIKGGAKSAQPAILDEVGGPGASSQGAAAPVTAQTQPCTPTIELVRIAGVAKSLQVQCACGETITIELQYDQEQSPLTQ